MNDANLQPFNCKPPDIADMNDKSDICNECGIRFGLKADLARHALNQRCETAFVCPQCKLSYIDEEDLNKHMHIRHPPDASKDVCQSAFTLEEHLKQRNHLHPGENSINGAGATTESSQKERLHPHELVRNRDNLDQCVDFSKVVKGKLMTQAYPAQKTLNLDDTKNVPESDDVIKHTYNRESEPKSHKIDVYNCSFESSSKFDAHKMANNFVKLHDGCGTTLVANSEKPPQVCMATADSNVRTTAVDSDITNSNAMCSESVTCSDAPYKGSTHSNQTYDNNCPSPEEKLNEGCNSHRPSTATAYNCEFCGAIFGTRSILQEHRLVHTSGESHKCLYCGAVFTARDQFTEHLRIHFSASAYSCLDCRVNFATINSLNDHLRSHHSSKKIQPCGSNVEAINNACKRSLGPVHVKPHNCEECTASFASKRELWDHITVHSDSEMTYTCQECGVAFAQIHILTDHIRAHHPTSKEYDNCDFDTKPLMYGRQPGHSVLMPFQCVHCGNEFLSENELVDHNRIHTSQTTCACQDCGLVFADPSGLNKHILSRHPGDKAEHSNKVSHNCCRTDNPSNPRARSDYFPSRPFKCEICGSDFSRKTHLIRHALIHTGEKPHKCEQCGKAFGRKSHLQRHALIHTGLKPYICNHCGMAFGRKSHLKRHSLRQHGEPPSSPPSPPQTPVPSPKSTEHTVSTNHAVAFPGMQPQPAKQPQPAPSSFQATSQIKQELEHDLLRSPPPFSSRFKPSPDPSQLPQSNPYWNLFQPVLSFNINEALNWSRQNETHNAYPNVKHQKPIT